MGQDQNGTGDAGEIDQCPTDEQLPSDKRIGMHSLVLADVYYPGWKAFVDGKAARIYRPNYVVRAVSVPRGRHLEEFRYEPLSCKIGAIISLAALVLMVGFLIWVNCKRSKEIKG
jgi:uncharacterized membrane protein YfhO